MLVRKRSVPTWKKKIVIVLNAMADYLNAAQMKKLQGVLIKELSENELERSQVPNRKIHGVISGKKED